MVMLAILNVPLFVPSSTMFATAVANMVDDGTNNGDADRSEEHTSELQSLTNLVCRLLPPRLPPTPPPFPYTTLSRSKDGARTAAAIHGHHRRAGVAGARIRNGDAGDLERAVVRAVVDHVRHRGREHGRRRHEQRRC